MKGWKTWASIGLWIVTGAVETLVTNGVTLPAWMPALLPYLAGTMSIWGVGHKIEKTGVLK